MPDGNRAKAWENPRLSAGCWQTFLLCGRRGNLDKLDVNSQLAHWWKAPGLLRHIGILLTSSMEALSHVTFTLVWIITRNTNLTCPKPEFVSNISKPFLPLTCSKPLQLNAHRVNKHTGQDAPALKSTEESKTSCERQTPRQKKGCVHVLTVVASSSSWSSRYKAPSIRHLRWSTLLSVWLSHTENRQNYEIPSWLC